MLKNHGGHLANGIRILAVRHQEIEGGSKGQRGQYAKHRCSVELSN
jgi:hypothetical protein